MTEPVFRLNALTFRYPSRRRAEGPPLDGPDADSGEAAPSAPAGNLAPPALNELSAEIPSGVTGVLGLSGSGKTTLLNILGLLDESPVGAGQVMYRPTDAKPIDYGSLSSRRRAQLRQAEFGFVLQSSLLLPHLTCLENVIVPLALAGLRRAERVAAAEELFRQADPTGRLYRLRHDRSRNVSGGERQRVAILRAVAHDPRVVFADEPFSNLDPRNTDQILTLLRRWLAGELHPGRVRPDRTLLLVSHTVALTIGFAAGRCLVIRNGQATHRPDDLPLSPTDDPFGPSS